MSNLVNLEKVSKSFGIRILLDEVSLGVGVGERIGIVGRNGDGKTTLLNLMTGREEPDGGRVSRSRGLHLGYLDQRDLLDDSHTVREVVLGGKADHEWAADPTTREVVEVLLDGIALDRVVHGLSGGERRRCSLAKLLLEPDDLLILDEPTNHLDVEAIAWLADHLKRRASGLVVVTHDRWFLDEVCEQTWEVHDGVIDTYEGGYAAFVLAKNERMRQASASEQRRQNLMRKELAWLRRGAPARTSKPKFRIDAANELIADEPPPRDRLALERFATQRLGKDVVDLEDVDLVRGERTLLKHATWRLGPGDRVGIVGVNGAGKTSVLSLVSGILEPTKGKVKRGRTVAMQHLTQNVTPEDPLARVLTEIEDIRRVTRTASGQELSATSMLERFGFTGDRLTARLGDLSGGERRRFQLLKLLLSEPNVLLLDEPTNDLDIETLAVLEDFLDGWPGTLIVVSHDRYFLERVTDSVWALMGDGTIGMLPGGVDQYLEMRKSAHGSGVSASSTTVPSPPVVAEVGQQPTRNPGNAKAKIGGAEERAARKTIARVEKQIARLLAREAELNAEIAQVAEDYVTMGKLAEELNAAQAERDGLELEWLEASAQLDYCYGDRVITLDQVLTFGLAALIIIAIPGPSVVFVVGRALTYGRTVALASVAGNSLGLLTVIVLVALGLGVVVQDSHPLFLALKLAGAAYLLWLGIEGVRRRKEFLDQGQATDERASRMTWQRAIRQGYVVGVSNPKGYLMMAAVLPQFIDRGAGHLQVQMLLLGLIAFAIGIASDSLWALVASRLRTWFAGSARRGEAVGAVGGISMIGLGVAIAVTGER